MDQRRGSQSPAEALNRPLQRPSRTPLRGTVRVKIITGSLVLFGRHLVGVWIGGVWNGHFPESERYFSEAEISSKIPEIRQKERFSPNFRLRNLKIQSPKKMQFHTPSHSIPPLDSLLFIAENVISPKLPLPLPS